MSTLLWIVVGLAYLAALLFLGLMALRKGHFICFLAGFVLPIFWLVGAVFPPTARAREAAQEADARAAARRAGVKQA